MRERDTQSFIQAALEKRRREKRLRSLRPVEGSDSNSIISIDGKPLINFSGNDYLGLSKHAKLISTSNEYSEKFGSGSTASRLISGTLSIHSELEDRLADFFGFEDCLIFN